MLTQYFSCLGRTGAVSIKNAPEHVTSKLCFCIRHMRVMYGIVVRLWRQTSMHYFSCLGGIGTDSTNSELVFFHLMGSAGHVVDFGASGA